MQNHNNIDNGIAAFSTREERNGRAHEEVPGTARESSITIGNKSKADATIARRALHDGRPISRLSQPPADNTTVFGKYKTIHEPARDCHPRETREC